MQYIFRVYFVNRELNMSNLFVCNYPGYWHVENKRHWTNNVITLIISHILYCGQILLNCCVDPHLFCDECLSLRPARGRYQRTRLETRLIGHCQFIRLYLWNPDFIQIIYTKIIYFYTYFIQRTKETDLTIKQTYIKDNIWHLHSLSTDRFFKVR